MAQEARPYLWVFAGTMSAAAMGAVALIASAWINSHKGETVPAAPPVVASSPIAKPPAAAQEQPEKPIASEVPAPASTKHVRSGRRRAEVATSVSAKPPAPHPATQVNVTKNACSNVNTTVNAPTINNCSGFSQ